MNGKDISPIRNFIINNFDIEWDDEIINYFDCDASFYMCKKSRQCGYSFAASAKALARAMLLKRNQNIISIKREEAANKIAYVKHIINKAKFDFDLKVVSDSVNRFSFQLPTEEIVSITSHPCSSARGYAGDVLLDEAWHYPISKFRDIWRGILALGVRVDGCIEIISTPSYAEHPVEIMYNDFLNKPSKEVVIEKKPWWVFKVFSKNVKEAKEYALSLPTEERVAMYGTERLKQQFNNAIYIEDFQSEFECENIGDNINFISVDMLSNIIDNELPLIISDNPILHGSNYTVGIDMGRNKDMTVAAFMEDGNKLTHLIILKKTSLPLQQEILLRTLEKYKNIISHIGIDYTGIGLQIGDKLKMQFGNIVDAINFNPSSKRMLAERLLYKIQNEELVIPNNSTVISHLISIKEEINPNTGMKSYKSHALDHNGDIFWAIALGLGNAGVKSVGTIVDSKIANNKKEDISDYLERYAI